jgi:hypothetical protein
MEDGRLIRVAKYRGDPTAVACIVAIADPDLASNLIRIKIAGPEDDVQDLGRVSDALVRALKLLPGQYMRTDQMSGCRAMQS